MPLVLSASSPVPATRRAAPGMMGASSDGVLNERRERSELSSSLDFPGPMINLYSDTQTLPTQAMYDAIRDAELGDDVIRSDPTVNSLEEEVAAMLGKAAALLVPSGTMANLVSAMVHGGSGDEIFLDPDAHVYYYEVGGLCSIAGYVPHFVTAERGRPDPDALLKAIRPENVHYPRPRLLWLENTHNRGGGTVLEPERQEALVAIARENGLAVHVDGARLFNAAAALGRPVAELVANVDTVNVCLSKGLSCPVGSVIAGPGDLIDRAREIRKRLGGGMRQGGIVAAAGRVAIREMVNRLSEDHVNARALAEGLVDVPGVVVDTESVQTNMVYVDVSAWNIDAFEAKKVMEADGVLVCDIDAEHLRLVTHRLFSADDVPVVLKAFKDLGERVAS